ncbi:MAG: ABC transporter permease [Ktedonobacterales bacterium]
MKSSSLVTTEKAAARVHSTLYWLLADTLVLTKRQLLHVPRIPQDLMVATLEPALLLVLFWAIFGGAMAVPGASYANYLVSGFLVLAVFFGNGGTTAVGVATDLERGLVDRFRSLPMARSAVLTGRTLADLVRSVLVILVVWAVGLLIGFRPAGAILNWVAALGLLLLSSFMLSWFSVLLGLVVRSAEAVQQAFAACMAILVFASSAFVPTSTMPGWLRPFAEHQPVSLIINAVRGLVLNRPDATATWQAIAWCMGLLVVLIPTSVWAYGRRSAR